MGSSPPVFPLAEEALDWVVAVIELVVLVVVPELAVVGVVEDACGTVPLVDVAGGAVLVVEVSPFPPALGGDSP
jgi:hypothetical protein